MCVKLRGVNERIVDQVVYCCSSIPPGILTMSTMRSIQNAAHNVRDGFFQYIYASRYPMRCYRLNHSQRYDHIAAVTEEIPCFWHADENQQGSRRKVEATTTDMINTHRWRAAFTCSRHFVCIYALADMSLGKFAISTHAVSSSRPSLRPACSRSSD